MGGGTPTTYTIYSDEVDQYLASANPAGPADPPPGQGTSLFVGQNSPSTYYEAFVSFDTSVVLGAITSVTLSVYGSNNSSDTDFTLEARIHDWGASVAADDWVAAASLGGKTLVGTLSTAAYSTSAYNAFTSEAAFVSNINQSGATRLVINSNRMRLGNAPGGPEFVGFRSANQTGTTNDPKLVIEALV